MRGGRGRREALRGSDPAPSAAWYLGQSWCRWVPRSSSQCCPSPLGGPSVPTPVVRSACCSGLTSLRMSSPLRPQTMPGCSCSWHTTGKGRVRGGGSDNDGVGEGGFCGSSPSRTPRRRDASSQCWAQNEAEHLTLPCSRGTPRGSHKPSLMPPWDDREGVGSPPGSGVWALDWRTLPAWTEPHNCKTIRRSIRHNWREQVMWVEGQEYRLRGHCLVCLPGLPSASCGFEPVM